MSVTPEKDPNYIYAHPYATLIADEYRMRGGYCIVRPGGTDDHLMLLTRAGRGLFRTPRGDAVPLAARTASRRTRTQRRSSTEPETRPPTSLTGRPCGPPRSGLKSLLPIAGTT